MTLHDLSELIGGSPAATYAGGKGGVILSTRFGGFPMCAFDTGRKHGPSSDTRGIDCGCGWGMLCDTGAQWLCDCRPHHGGAHA